MDKQDLTIQNKKVSLITPILDNLPFGSDIKNTAQNYYNELTNGLHKSNKRNQLAFFCILKSLHEHEIYTDPIYVSKLLKMSKPSMHSSMSMSETDDKVIIRKPTDYIDYYLNLINTKYNIILDKNRIIQIIDRVMNNNPISVNIAPQTICYSVIYYYINLNNYPISKEDYAQMCYVSTTCLKKMLNFVIQADNS